MPQVVQQAQCQPASRIAAVAAAVALLSLWRVFHWSSQAAAAVVVQLTKPKVWAVQPDLQAFLRVALLRAQTEALATNLQELLVVVRVV
jgi:hypothetical protein